MSGVLIFLAVVVGGFAANLILPVLVSATTSDGHAGTYLLLIALLAFVAGGFYLALQGRPMRIGRVGSYALLMLCWASLSVAGAIPFALVAGFSATDALFEAVSGLTTTGSTLLKDPAVLPPSLILWRSQLQWIGGLLTLLSIILVLAPAGVGGLPDRHIRLIEHAGQGGDFRIAQSVVAIASAYLLSSLLCFIGLVISRIPLIDAACLTFSTVSTGGFLPVSGSMSAYSNRAAEAIVAVFMIIGASSVLWQRMILRQRWNLLATHRESYYVISIALLVGLAYGVAGILKAEIASGRTSEALSILASGLFTGISLVTTTGFEDKQVPFIVLPLTAVIVAVFVGGGTFSTAGGVKMYRFGGMVVQSFRELGRLVYPHGIRPAHFGSQPYDIQLMKAIWSFFVVAILVVIFGAILLAFDIPKFEGALLASVVNFANVGPIYGSGWPGSENWPAYGDMSDFAKSVCIALMLLGRIEILALFGALNLTYWKNR